MASNLDTAADRKGQQAIAVAWIVMCAITITAWWLSPARSSSPVTPSLPVTAAAIVLGFVKCRLIVRYFMEVNTAPRWLRLATDGWLCALWFTVLAIYMF